MKSDFNQAEIIRLKAELEKAKLVAANTLRAINSKNTASNAEIEYMLAEIKMKSDSGQLEINRLKKELEKIKAPSINASTPLNSAGGIVHISESDYFLDINGIPVSNGFYVVIGTFGNRENADRFRASNMIKGHLNTKIIRNQFTKVYNIFVLKTNNRADADAERMKYKAEYPDVWILKLE